MYTSNVKLLQYVLICKDYTMIENVMLNRFHKLTRCGDQLYEYISMANRCTLNE